MEASFSTIKTIKPNKEQVIKPHKLMNVLKALSSKMQMQEQEQQQEKVGFILQTTQVLRRIAPQQAQDKVMVAKNADFKYATA